MFRHILEFLEFVKVEEPLNLEEGRNKICNTLSLRCMKWHLDKNLGLEFLTTLQIFPFLTQKLNLDHLKVIQQSQSPEGVPDIEIH